MFQTDKQRKIAYFTTRKVGRDNEDKENTYLYLGKSIKKSTKQKKEKQSSNAKISCNCLNSKCQKLYCECFSANSICDPSVCSCKDCLNNDTNKVKFYFFVYVIS